MKFISKISVAFVAVLLFSTICFATTTTPTWQLAFENDAAGSTVSGSFSALADAVDAGASLKVICSYPGSNIGFTYYPNHVFVDRGHNLVYAYWSGNRVEGPEIITMDQNLILYFLARTDGQKEYIARTPAGAFYERGFESQNMKWFVNK